jgi:hypothetical protein
MDIEFITLSKLGVGPVLVRYDDIITMELTPMGCTRVEFGYGEHLIVEEEPFAILRIIKEAKLLSELDNNNNNKSGVTEESRTPT